MNENDVLQILMERLKACEPSVYAPKDFRDGYRAMRLLALVHVEALMPKED